MPKRWLGWLFLGVWLGAARAAHADLTVSTDSLNIGSADVGASFSGSITVSASPIAQNVMVVAAPVASDDCTQFSVSPSNLGSVNSTSKLVTVTFQPTSPGDKICTYDITSTSTTTVSVVAHGHGKAAVGSVTPAAGTTLAFNSVNVGRISTSQRVTITNTGELTLGITKASFVAGASDYRIVTGASRISLLPGENTFWDLACQPSLKDSRGGTFEIESNAFGATRIDINLTCTGLQGALVANQATAAVPFGPVLRGTTRSITVMLNNPGNVDVTGLVATINPTGKGYAIVANTLPSTLAAGATKAVTVSFTPQSKTDGGTATLSFSGSWSTAETATANQLTLTGQDASFQLSPAPPVLDFGSFRFDAPPKLAFEVVNDGAAALAIQAAFTPDGSTKANEIKLDLAKATLPQTPPAPLASDEHLVVTVTPQIDRRIGALGGHVDVSTTIGGLQQAVVTGTATASNVKIPATVDFGVIDIRHPATQTITIENTGNDSLDITALRLTSPNDTSPNPAFMLQPPTIPAQLAPGGALEIPIVYSPTMVTGSDPDAVILHASFTGALDATATVQITGAAAMVAFSFHGGGGCAARGGAGTGTAAAILLALVICFVRRGRGARSLPALVVTLMLAAGGAARADDVLVGVYQPTPATQSTGFQLESPEVGAPGSWVATSVASYASDLLVLDTYRNGTQLPSDRAIRRRTMLGVGGAYAFLSRFEAGLWLPMYMQRGDAPSASQTGGSIAPASGTALGDLTLHGKVRLVRIGDAALGATLHVTLPTASAGQFTGVDLPTLRALALLAWSPRRGLTLSASAGGVLRKTSVHRDTAAISQGSGLPWGAGLVYQVRERWSASAEVFGELARGGADADMTTLALAPVEGLVGARYRAGQRVVLGVAIGRGLSDGIGAPAMRGVASLSYEAGAPRATPGPAERSAPERDGDGDGIIDRLDRCPQAAEDKDGFQDDDGCPDLDNDGDGIADAADKCPDQAEDKDGFQDGDGCPDPDNDGDGIADALDRCPGEPETVNGKDDEDGCPDSATAPAASSSSPTGSPVRAAEAAFTRGRTLMAAAKYAEACDAFQQSQRLDPQFGTQYNLAGCSEKTGKLATAWALYRQLARSDTNPARRARSEQLAAALAPRVPRLRITLPAPPAGVRVTLNGADASALVGAETPVDFGHYTVAAVAAGYWAWQQIVEIARDGQVATVAIDLQPTH